MGKPLKSVYAARRSGTSSTTSSCITRGPVRNLRCEPTPCGSSVPGLTSSNSSIIDQNGYVAEFFKANRWQPSLLTIRGLPENNFSSFALVVHDGAIGSCDQLIDERWRRFTSCEVPLDCGDWRFQQHEPGSKNLRRARAAEDLARKSGHALLKPLCLLTHPFLELVGPIALNEVMAAVERKQSRIFHMFAGPAWQMQRGSKAVARLDCRDKSHLKFQHQFQPKLAEQHIAGCEAVIEGALRSLETARDRIRRHCGGPALGRQEPGGFEKAGVVIKRTSHDFPTSAPGSSGSLPEEKYSLRADPGAIRRT